MEKKTKTKIKEKVYTFIKGADGYGYFVGDKVNESVIKKDLEFLLKNKIVE